MIPAWYMARSCPVSSSCQYHGKFWKYRTCVILKKALGLGDELYENRVHTQLCPARPWSCSHKAQPLGVKSNINSIGVHPQLSNNGPPVDGALVGSGSLRVEAAKVLMYCIGRGLFEIKFYFLGKQGGKIWNQETPSSFSSQGIPLKEKGKYIKFQMKQHHLMLTKISRVSLTNP